jgi:hypothetical protein
MKPRTGGIHSITSFREHTMTSVIHTTEASLDWFTQPKNEWNWSSSIPEDEMEAARQRVAEYTYTPQVIDEAFTVAFAKFLERIGQADC